MKINKLTYAVAASLLAALAVVVLWRYHVEIEPFLATGDAAAASASSHFQIVFMLGVAAAGVLLLFFLELALFRPLASLKDAMDRMCLHEDDVETRALGAGPLGDLSESLRRLIADMRANDQTLRDKDLNLNHRLLVEEALAKVARNLLRESTRGIPKSLRILGRNLDTDVVSYWRLTDGGDAMRCIGTFRDPETGEFAGDFDFTAPAAKWISEAIRADRHLIIDDAEKVPAEMAEVKSFIGEYGLQSFLGVPLKVPGSNLGGLVAFGDIHKVRHWSKEDLRALEVVAELFTDQIGRATGSGVWTRDEEGRPPDRK